MTRLPDDLPLILPDLDSGIEYLGKLDLGNPEIAAWQLDRLLDTVASMPPEPPALLQLLEATRTPLVYVIDELARNYLNKPLPLGTQEEAAFQVTTTLLGKLVNAYELCLPAQFENGSDIQQRTFLATVLQRCLYFDGRLAHEHYRARREQAAGLWLKIHLTYQKAENLHVDRTSVEFSDPAGVRQTHCAAAYVALLLVEIACPYSHALRDLTMIRRWAEMWATQVGVSRIDSAQLPTYLIDLSQDAPLHATDAVTTPGPQCRQLDVSRMAGLLQHVLEQLRLRIPPSQLGLGDETAGRMISVLESLRRPWTLQFSIRRFRRFPAHGTALIVPDFPGMYSHVTGKEFGPEEDRNTYSRGNFDEIFIFRDQLASEWDKPNFPTEAWEVVNHSAYGFRLLHESGGHPIFHGQLLALKPHDGDKFILGFVTWLIQDSSGELEAGVCTFPGIPQGIGVRFQISGTPSSERFTQAFQLPAIASCDIETSLILPSGLYQASRVLEVYDENGQIWKAQMNHILQRGTNFDRVSFRTL